MSHQKLQTVLYISASTMANIHAIGVNYKRRGGSREATATERPPWYINATAAGRLD